MRFPSAPGLDVIAPGLHQLLKRQLFTPIGMRFLDRRGTERDLKVQTSVGDAAYLAEAPAWLAANSVVACPHTGDVCCDGFSPDESAPT